MRLFKRTHCKYGHEFTPENTYWRTETKRMCKACMDRERKAAAEKLRQWREAKMQKIRAGTY